MQGTVLKIRKAETGDIEKISEIDTVVPLDSDRKKYIKRVVSSDEAMVAEVKGQIVGYAVFNKSFFGRPTIDMLMIDRDHRRRGIGTELMEHLEQMCESRELWTSTNLSNGPMQRLLARRSYMLTGFIDNLDPGDPELIYFKRLK